MTSTFKFLTQNYKLTPGAKVQTFLFLCLSYNNAWTTTFPWKLQSNVSTKCSCLISPCLVSKLNKKSIEASMCRRGHSKGLFQLR